MCTVTYIPQRNGMILTSNRDEHISRGIALYPEFYQFNDKKLAFPKDSKAGGTWFICNEQGDTGVLLNGAFEKHIPKPPYRKSRGWLLPEIFQHQSPLQALMEYNLEGIENFTIILWEKKQLTEIKWDGIKLFIKNHNPLEAHIWSSVTLYSEKMIHERHGWFYNWLQAGHLITQQHILDFHTHTNSNNKEYGLRILRDDEISTSSITSIHLENQKATFYHKDLIQQIESTLEYNLLQVPNIITPITTESEIA
jgi:Transport and Golgi organisation 2